jgi:hypothetical protein
MSKPTALFSLKPSVKEAWLEDLRSGFFKQGKEFLYKKETDSYCCLGVLCSQLVANVHMDDIGLPEDIGVVDLHNIHLDGLTYTSPWFVTVNSDCVPLTTDNDYVSLSSLNDYDELTFSQIADIIEATVPTHEGDEDVRTYRP